MVERQVRVSMTSPRSGSKELEASRRLKLVLKKSSSGMGLASAFVSVFSTSSDPVEAVAVKRILLGTPVEKALGALVADGSQSGEVIKFLAALGQMSATEASRGAEKLSGMFDRWTLLRERREMEGRVMAFRGLVISAVAGVVVGMLSSLAPVISSFQITLGGATATASGFSPWEGAVFLLPSVVCLGLFLSPKRPYVNALVGLATFAGVVYFMGPLATLSIVG